MPTISRLKKPADKDFQAVYAELKKIMAPFAKKPLRADEGPGSLQLFAPPAPITKGREVWFGAVKINKNYVSYHLMPVYACPDLLESLSPELKRRMQGKACFNFTTVDQALFKELRALTKKGYQRFKTEGFL
jgi:hypothetical protein